MISLNSTTGHLTQSLDCILGLQFLDLFQYDVYLLAKRVLLDHCILYQLAQDSVCLDQLACLELKIHPLFSHRKEL